MAALATFLIGIAGSVAARVLLSLGIGIVTFTGLSSLVSSMTSIMQAQYNGVPSVTLQLANLGGIGEFLGIVASAFVARIALLSIKKMRIT